LKVIFTAPPLAGRAVEVASQYATVAADDRADRVEYGEHGDLDVADLAEGAALARRLGHRPVEAVADAYAAPGTARPQREGACASRAQCGAPEFLIGIDRRAARRKVEADRALHAGDAHPVGLVAAQPEQLRGHA